MERKVKPHKENSKEKAWRHACLEKKKKKKTSQIVLPVSEASASH